MQSWKKLKELVKGKGRVKNYSKVDLLVIENSSEGRPIVHILKPGFKSPQLIDADGFKRFDGVPIRKHKSWIKIYNHTTAKVYGNNSKLKVDVLFFIKVSDQEFGQYTIDTKPWGTPIHNILNVKKNQKGNITKYYVENFGWISKTKAIRMTKLDLIDNAVVVDPKKGRTYLRSYPGQPSFSKMGTS